MITRKITINIDTALGNKLYVLLMQMKEDHSDVIISIEDDEP